MSAELFTRAVTLRIQDVLKPAGFRKKGMSNFKRELTDVVHFVQVQKSQKSTKDSAVVTINLGIYSFLVGDREGYKNVEPELAACHWRKRLGRFLPKPEDKWWELNNEESSRIAGEEICALLKEKALPELEQFSSTSELKQLWVTGESPGITEFQREKYLGMLANQE
jgi:hypothetical protein